MAGGGDEIKVEEPSLVAAGDELDRKRATTESLPQMLEWGKAACNADDIEKCVAGGAFYPGELVEWRSPKKGETPTKDQFVILSLTHMNCGLRLDASDFLVSVLKHYGIQWFDLTPNSITALSVFAHLCEAYIEVPPTVEVFTNFYRISQNVRGARTALGQAYFRLRAEMKKNYPMYNLKSSQYTWGSLWFYANVPQSCRLSFRFRGDSLEEKNNNSKDLLLPLSPEQKKQVVRIRELSEQGLTGADIVHDYLKHRISPLRRRIHLACEYSGPSDPTRDSDTDLSGEDITKKLSYLLDLKKMGVKQLPDRPNVPSSLVRASADDRGNQPLGLLNVFSTHEAKKKALEEITASVNKRKPSMIGYKESLVRASVRYRRQSVVGPRKAVVPTPLETDSCPTQGHLDPEESLVVTTNITTAASPKRGVEQKSIENPAEVEEGRIAELAKPVYSVIGAKRKDFAPRSCSHKKAKYSLHSILTKNRMSSSGTGSIKGTSSTKKVVQALNAWPPGLARHPPASLAEEAGIHALFMLANAVDQTKVVEDSMSNVLPVRYCSRMEVDAAQSISERVRDHEAIEVSAAIPVHNGEEINSEVIWERMQKVQSEYISLSQAASSELLEEAEKLVMENRRLKEGQTILEQQVKDLEDGRRLLTEENIKLKDENEGHKQRIGVLSMQNESNLKSLVHKCNEVNRHKEEAAQLIKEKEELQAFFSRVNDLVKLMAGALCRENTALPEFL